MVPPIVNTSEEIGHTRSLSLGKEDKIGESIKMAQLKRSRRKDIINKVAKNCQDLITMWPRLIGKMLS